MLQPVLAFGNGRWWFEPWNCCPAGHKVKGPSLEVGNAPLVGVIEAAPRGYLIRADNGTHRAALLADGAAAYNRLDLVLETYGVRTCASYPAGAMRFEDLRVRDNRSAFVPAWTHEPSLHKISEPTETCLK